jgi:hypothetical protein
MKKHPALEKRGSRERIGENRLKVLQNAHGDLTSGSVMSGQLPLSISLSH